MVRKMQIKKAPDRQARHAQKDQTAHSYDKQLYVLMATGWAGWLAPPPLPCFARSAVRRRAANHTCVPAPGRCLAAWPPAAAISGASAGIM